jgi:DNA-binding response OmpR family regulator
VGKLYSGKTFLIVDDEADIRKIVKFYFERKGAKILTAADGFEALEKVYSNKDISLIITDIKMPGIMGFEICKILKMQKEYNLIPIIIMSALADLEDIKYGLMVGADEYLVKPFELPILDEAVKKVFEKYEKLKKIGLEFNINIEASSDMNYIKEINKIATWIFSNNLNIDEWVVNDILYSLIEIVTNAIEHGNKKNIEKKVKIECKVFKVDIIIKVEDEGEGFEPEKVLKELENADIYRPRGRGLIITKNLMNELKFENNGKTIIMRKKITRE